VLYKKENSENIYLRCYDGHGCIRPAWFIYILYRLMNKYVDAKYDQWYCLSKTTIYQSV